MKKEMAIWLALPSLLLLVGCNATPSKPATSQIPNKIEYVQVSSVSKPEAFLSDMAQAEDTLGKGETEVTVYNSNLALIKERREIELKKGYNLIKYVDVPALINTTSVFFQDLFDTQAQVVEQSYQYDLISREKLLDKYVDKELTIQVREGDSIKEYKGKLLSASGGILLQTDQGVKSFSDVANVSFSEIPGGLLTKPTLIWTIYTEKDGKHDTQTSYLTGGLTWNADYIAVVDKADKNIDLKGWTTVKNNSGTVYPNAKLKLVAGDVNVVQPPRAGGGMDYDMMAKESVAAPAPQFTEQGLFEYHMYSLSRRTDLANNEEKQISLLEAKGVTGEKEFVFNSSSYYYYGSGSDQGKIQVKMKMKNTEAAGLGMPLPKGIVRVYKADDDGQLQFIGEDQIDHTPKDEEIELLLGNAFDLTADKKQTDSKYDSGLFGYKSCSTNKYEITLKNHKQEDVKIKVVENTSGTNLEVLDNNNDFTKEESGTLNFLVPVKANGEFVLKYTLRNCY